MNLIKANRVITAVSLIIAILMVGFLAVFLFTTAVAYKYPLKYQEQIKINAEKYDVQPEIIASVINAESRYREKAVSNKGALGLMQILPSTGKWIASQVNINEFQDEMLLDAKTNIQFGSYYLSYLMKKFSNFETVLASYNAGEGVVQGWLNNQEYSVDRVSLKTIPYKQTRNYIDKVNKSIKYYSKKY